jgi:hypothetical protein
MATPRYLVLRDIFVAPDKIFQGSVIETHAAPGEHLKPLNKEAEARLEEWYMETVEYTAFDQDGKPQLRKIQPHLKYKLMTNPVAVQHEVKVLKGPAKDAPGNLSLGESLVRRSSTDQRPGPAVTIEVDMDDLPEEEPVAKVLSAAPPPTTARRNS